MKENLREIHVYSSNSLDELDYRKKYWFHHWIGKKTALVENEEGGLLEAKYNEFKFKTESGNSDDQKLIEEDSESWYEK